MHKEINFKSFEGLGVWGLSGVPLEVQCNETLSELEVYIDSDSKEFLNIQAVEIVMNDGRNLLLSDLVESAELSSNYYIDTDGSNCVMTRLFERKLLHSQYELRPSLKIKFKEKTNIAAIRIFNRQGSCGFRSRFIALAGMDGDEKKVFISECF